MIFAVKPFEIHDGNGIRTTVFFKGCALRCKWCHNPESLRPEGELSFDAARCVHCLRCTALCDANTAQDGRHLFRRELCTLCGKCAGICAAHAFSWYGEERSPEALAQELVRDKLFYDAGGGGVTFSGGEPLLQKEYCVALAKLLRQQGIRLAVDTCGFVPRESLDAILPYTDMFLYDLKAIDEKVHIACTGQSNRLILDNLRYLDTKGVPFEIRCPFVPGYNDGEAAAIGRFAASLKNLTVLRILPYHSFAEDKYACLGMEYPAKEVPLPTEEQLKAARQLIVQSGVKQVAIG